MQTQKRNWLQLQRTLIQKYKICALNTQFKNLPLEIFITACSSFSGPIALLNDKGISHQLILPQNMINNIAIFNCKGELKKTVPYDTKDNVMFMGFNKVEELLIVEASGDYWLIDPFSGHVSQGNYTNPQQGKERYRGCEMLPNNSLILLRQKQLGYTEGLRSTYKPIPEIKIKVQNPVFSSVYGSTDSFIYLSKDHTIQLYSFAGKVEGEKKRLLYSDPYLNQNWMNLLAASFNQTDQKLGLVFSNPSKIFYIDILTKKNSMLDAMIDLQFSLEQASVKNLSYKKPSINKYKSPHYTLSWITGQCYDAMESGKSCILIFANPKILIMYDGYSTRLTPRSNCNQLVSVQSDCIRVYTEDSHEILRIVPYLYQTVVEIHKINEGYYIDKFRKIIQLHDEYTNYLEQQNIIDLSKLDNLWKMSTIPYHEHIQDIEKELAQQERVQISKQMLINKENTVDTRRKIEKVEEQVIRPLIQTVRFCIDPMDQIKMLKFICFIKNLYNSSIDIYDLCSQLRVINNLKFQFLNRTLTLDEFQYLKYEAKDRFLTILLRYNMHFVADTIFGDSSSKYQIFLHWSKCKIEKNSEAIAFQEIKQRYESFKKFRNSRVFTDIAKYSLDRGKTTLAENIISLDQNPDRRIMIYLLMLVSTADKKVVQKLLIAAEQSNRSFLIYRVVKQLIETSWIQNHLWVNILHGKPNVTRHYIQYLKSHKEEELLKKYYQQNQESENLEFFILERTLALPQDSQHEIPKFDEKSFKQFTVKVQSLKKFLPKINTITKSFTLNSGMQFLRKVKLTDYIPTEQEIKEVRNDNILEYLGEILFSKDHIDLAVSCFRKIKSDKAFTILMRKQRLDDALELAFDRKNKDAVLTVAEMFPSEKQAQIQQRLANLGRK